MVALAQIEPIFRQRVEKVGECWIWLGALCGSGYGATYVGRKQYATHRLAYELWIGTIPEGAHILHHCDNKLCVNPKHIYAGTPKQNAQDAARRGLLRNRNTNKTHCVRGHAFTEENTRIRVRGRKRYRDCRQCGKDRARLDRLRSKGGAQ